METPITTPPVQQNEELEEMKEGGITVEKTDHGFKFKGKFWTFIIVIVSMTACAIAIMLVMDKVGLIK
jgi:hypothetical protein